MAQAAYCSQCGANVYVGADGRCPRGHGPESLSNHYEVDDLPAAPPSAVGQAPKKSNTLLIVLVILGLFVVCGLGSCCAAIPLYHTISEEVMQEIDVDRPMWDQDAPMWEDDEF